VLPQFQPLPLTRRPQPFSHPDWLFELKYDGFRALAYCDPSGVRLVSRNGNHFSSFPRPLPWDREYVYFLAKAIVPFALQNTPTRALKVPFMC
jgi:ATP-dependent DNA ligase